MSISVTAFVEIDFFPSVSLISFCSRLKVVFLYCNYYLFALCRNLLLWFGNSKTFADREFTWCVLELALARSFRMELALARSLSKNK